MALAHALVDAAIEGDEQALRELLVEVQDAEAVSAALLNVARIELDAVALTPGADGLVKVTWIGALGETQAVEPWATGTLDCAGGNLISLTLD